MAESEAGLHVPVPGVPVPAKMPVPNHDWTGLYRERHFCRYTGTKCIPGNPFLRKLI